MKRILLSICICISLGAFAQIPTDSLVLHLPFTGNANDVSGNGNHGTVNGATLTTDRFGNQNSAYTFDGLNDWINMPSGSSTSLNITGDLTISFWFKTIVPTGNGIIGFGDNISGTGGYLFSLGQSVGNDSLMSAFTGVWRFGNIVLNDAVWHNATIVLKSDTLLIYSDNVLDITYTSNPQPSSWNGLRAIGARNNGAGGYFDGLIDDIRVYNRALDSNEVATLFTEGQCFETVYDTVTTYISVQDTLVINAVLTGVAAPNNINTVKVYPNPANNQITIDNGNLSSMTGYSMEIKNSLGQSVFQSAVNQQQFTLNLNSWSGNGLYFLYITDTNSNIIEIKKIVLQ